MLVRPNRFLWCFQDSKAESFPEPTTCLGRRESESSSLHGPLLGTAVMVLSGLSRADGWFSIQTGSSPGRALRRPIGGLCFVHPWNPWYFFSHFRWYSACHGVQREQQKGHWSGIARRINVALPVHALQFFLWCVKQLVVACFQTLPAGLQNALVSQGAEPGALRAWMQLLEVARQDSDRITSTMAAVPPEQRAVLSAQRKREGKVETTGATTTARSCGSRDVTVTPCSSKAFAPTICTVSPASLAATLAYSTMRRRVAPVGPRKHFHAAPTSICQRAEREATARSKTRADARTRAHLPPHREINLWSHRSEQVVEHPRSLRVRAEQGASRSTLNSIRAALSFFELAAGVEAKNQLIKKRVFLNTFAETMTSAKAGKPPRQAPRLSIIMLSALEDAVFDVGAFAWWHLVKCWGVHLELSLGQTPNVVTNRMENSSEVGAVVPRLPVAFTSRPWFLRQVPRNVAVRRFSG